MSTEILIEDIEIRHPRSSDATPLYHLIETIGSLERNTSYAYLLLCSHFASGSLIAVHEEEPVAFVLGYRPPSQGDAMFVWQVGVHPRMRGLGLAGALLARFAELPEYRDCQFLEATVGSSNEASQALFRAFAREQGVTCTQSVGFPSYLFPENHEDEDLYRIGPLRS